jgi:peroxiredoxin family protein
VTDLPAFCNANELECLGTEKSGGVITGRVVKPGGPQRTAVSADPARPASPPKNGATLVVFSNDLDKVLASFVIANGAAAMGGEVTMFFTFWGLNALRKDQVENIPDKTVMDKMFGWMMPRGANKLKLSQMHMMGMGTKMMVDRMKQKSLPNLPGLMQDAQKAGVRLVACSMSMEAMGIRQEELLDGVEIGGVADFLGAAGQTPANLFI